jgi:hypothetical protein
MFWKHIPSLSSELKSKQNKKPAEASSARLSLPSASASFLLSSLFDPEDGGDVFLQNFRNSPKYKALNWRDLTFDSRSH